MSFCALVVPLQDVQILTNAMGTIFPKAQSVFDLYVPDVDGTIYFIVDIIGTHSWLMSSLQVRVCLAKCAVAHDTV
jgi:hypothetical protein